MSKEIEKAVLVGDVHIGYNNKETGLSSNEDSFKQFVEEKVVEIDPDVLVINGDLIELWRSSFSDILVSKSKIFSKITKLQTKHGIDIVPLVGNHDYRLIETGRDIINEPEEIWAFQEEYFFTSGGKEFVATHGHQTDSVNRSRWQNSALCLTTEGVGRKLSNAWASALDRPILGWLIERDTIIGPSKHDSFAADMPLGARPNLKSLSHIENPGALSKEENAGRFARSIALLKQKYDEIIIGAHTHAQEVQEDEYYNAGDWLGNDAGYVLIEDGNVEVLDY